MSVLVQIEMLLMFPVSSSSLNQTCTLEKTTTFIYRKFIHKLQKCCSIDACTVM